jgi:hypothetical protein
MQEIAPGLLGWTAFRDTIGKAVHSHYVAAPGVLMDPMPPDGELPGAPRLVVLINGHHLRHAAEYDCPIRCHQAGLHQFAGAAFDVRGFAFGDEPAPDVRGTGVPPGTR